MRLRQIEEEQVVAWRREQLGGGLLAAARGSDRGRPTLRPARADRARRARLRPRARRAHPCAGGGSGSGGMSAIAELGVDIQKVDSTIASTESPPVLDPESREWLNSLRGSGRE